MNTTIKKYNLMAIVMLLVAAPILLWSRVNISHRAVYKEIVSVITILAFFQLLGQFYLSRINRLTKYHKMARVVKIHKVIGYLFVSILLVHPFLIVLPRYFEPGVSVNDAFITLITTFHNYGLVLGIMAWVLMLLLGLTSLLRTKLGLKYTTWRLIHGVLSVLFISLATWHAIHLGRHTDTTMSLYMIVLAGLGISLYGRKWLKANKKVGGNNE